jgi:hypothetical protein
MHNLRLTISACQTKNHFLHVNNSRLHDTKYKWLPLALRYDIHVQFCTETTQTSPTDSGNADVRGFPRSVYWYGFHQPKALAARECSASISPKRLSLVNAITWLSLPTLVWIQGSTLDEQSLVPGAGGRPIYGDYFDIGTAVQTERGLLHGDSRLYEQQWLWVTDETCRMQQRRLTGTFWFLHYHETGKFITAPTKARHYPVYSCASQHSPIFTL